MIETAALFPGGQARQLLIKVFPIPSISTRLLGDGHSLVVGFIRIALSDVEIGAPAAPPLTKSSSSSRNTRSSSAAVNSRRSLLLLD
jgi:hypothetical protein